MEDISDTHIGKIQDWLGTGSINIFGIQFSGKDTVGKQLAGLFDAEFVSSGDVMRSTFLNDKADQNDAIWQASKVGSLSGALMPTYEFRDMMASYLMRPVLQDKPLILSTVGRWIGEEGPIMEVLNKTNHPTKAVILLNISQDEAWSRWRHSAGERDGGRHDDIDQQAVMKRFAEYQEKTSPVIEVYRNMGILIEVDGQQSRDKVMRDTIDALYDFSHA